MTIATPGEHNANSSRQKLTHALKEWQVAVAALERGETILLLRKGGLHEADGQFTIAHQHVLLYPTYEHQRSHLVKAQYAGEISHVESGWHPETVRLSAWATLTDRFQVSNAMQLAALFPFHIWNEAFVIERLKWKASQPLTLLLLRVYQLGQPQMLPYRAAYGGCKSWLDLTAIAQETDFARALADSTPVLETADYNDRCATIRAIVGE